MLIMIILEIAITSRAYSCLNEKVTASLSKSKVKPQKLYVDKPNFQRIYIVPSEKCTVLFTIYFVKGKTH